MSAIPCLSYRRALEDEKKLKESVLKNQENEKLDSQVEHENGNGKCEEAAEEKTDSTAKETPTGDEVDKANEEPPAKKMRTLGPFTNAKIETVKENLKEQSLTVQQIHDYCRSLFIFKNIRVMRFS